MPPLERERINPAIEVLRLNRPEARNAMDSAMVALLIEAVEELAADPELMVLVLSTTDVTALSAGADVREQLTPEAGVARMEAFSRLYLGLSRFPMITVAVCVGNVVGAGAELAAGADLRVGGDNLKLGWVGARHGVPVGPGRLVPLVGESRAKELILTGRMLGMADADALGLLARTAPAAEAEAVALELAQEIAGKNPAGIRGLKTLFRGVGNTDARLALEHQALIEFQREGAGLPQFRGGAA